ncbi:Site-specific recombinase XerC [Mycobacteroides abscessus subsp. abscessus]|nr:Site-specific recombinase XerC [Mycobacteroides abscessus subsp. abscessus]
MGKKKKKQKAYTVKNQELKPKVKKSNLDIAKENVEAVFREAEKAGLGVKKAKMRKSTYESYKKSMITMLNDLAKMESPDFKRLLPRYMNGETWDEYFKHLADRYERGTLTAGQIQRRAHALESFRHFINNTDVCGKRIKTIVEGKEVLVKKNKIRIGNKEDRLDYLQDRGVVRSKDEITASKPTLTEVDLVQFHMNKKTKNGQVSLVINQLQNETGGRIKSIFKLEVRDIDFNKKTITFRNDKNNFTRTVPMTVAAEKLLHNACFRKKPGSPVYTLQYKDGNDMNLKDAVKTVQRYTNNAAKKAGINCVNRRFTTHSNRKSYAQRLYNQTRYMSKAQLRKFIGDYVRLQGSNQDIIVERMKKELERVNYYRKKNGLPKTAFTHEHLRRLYVSLHLGHSRQDVVARNYINVDKPKK